MTSEDRPENGRPPLIVRRRADRGRSFPVPFFRQCFSLSGCSGQTAGKFPALMKNGQQKSRPRKKPAFFFYITSPVISSR